MSKLPLPDAPPKTHSILPKLIFFGGVGLLLVVGVLSTGLWGGAGGGPGGGAIQPVSADVHLTMQVLISIVLLFSTLFVVLSKKYDAKDKHWAYTTIGLIIGFWLKP